jgi:hypothetical protein
LAIQEGKLKRQRFISNVQEKGEEGLRALVFLRRGTKRRKRGQAHFSGRG